MLGGGRSPIIALPPIGRPLRLEDIRTLARADGYRGAALARVAEDVMIFETLWLEAEVRSVTDFIGKMNG